MPNSGGDVSAPTSTGKKVKQSVPFSLREKDIKSIEKTIDDTIAKYVESLPEKINDILNQLVTTALGFKSDSWGRFEVDRYGASFLSRLITEKAQKIAEAAVAKHTPTLDSKFDDAIRKEYAERLQSCFDQHFSYAVKEHFNGIMKELLDTSELKFDLKVEPPKNKKDLANPNHMASTPKLRDLILQSVVENDGKERKESSE